MFATAITDDSDVEAVPEPVSAIIDNFNRIHVPPSPSDPLGDASGGGRWVGTPAGTNTGWAVDGSVFWTTRTGGTPGVFHLPTSVVGSEFTVRARFRTTGPIASSTGGNDSWLYLGVSDQIKTGYFFGGDGPFLEIRMENGLLANYGGDKVLQLGLWGGDALYDPAWDGPYVYRPALNDVVTFVTGEWFFVQWHFRHGVVHEAKIWAEGDSEPEYQVADPLTYRYGPGVTDFPAFDANVTGTYLWMVLYGDGRMEVDEIREIG